MNMRSLLGKILTRLQKPAHPNPRSSNKPLFRKPQLQILEDRVQPHGGGFGYLPPSHFLINSSSETSLASPQLIAQSYLEVHAAEFGLDQGDLVGTIVTDQYTDADTGTTYLYFRQTVNGLEVNNANISVGVKGGRVISAAGGFVADLDETIATIQPVVPNLTAIQAVQRAASELGMPVHLLPRETNSSTGVAYNTVISAPEVSLDPILARLQYVPTADGGAELGWQLIIRTPDGKHWYDLTVGDADGEIEALADWAGVKAARYNVIPLPNESPIDGGFRVLNDPADSIASPFGWHDTDGSAGAEFTDTRGNNVLAHLDRDDNNIPDADEGGLARPDGGPTLDFSGFTYNQGADPTTTQNANFAQLNLFYVINTIHDVTYKYGFTEVAGNFQTNNYGKGGAGGDAVQADAQDGIDVGSTDNANFATPPDGQAPRMQQFVFTFSNPRRDSDLDNGIIIHEYTHGISNRLTGGPSNASALNALQSAGMGEGWSDYVALMLTMRASDTQNAGYAQGLYALNNQPLFQGFPAGVRHFPYSYNMAINPLTFANYNVGEFFAGDTHNTGEIWCTALFDFTWLLINKYGFDADLSTGYTGQSGPGSAGNKLALRLVLDAMKLQPANPTLIQARDAIFAADLALTGGANRLELQIAFARRGLGPNASTPNANSGILIPDFTSPFQIGIDDPSVAAPEGAIGPTPVTISVSLAVANFDTVTVSYATQDGTATIADNDYQAASGTLTFAPGELTKSFTVFINGDPKIEGNETFLVRLTSASNASIVGGADVAVVTIQEDDPSVNIGPMVSVTEGANGTTVANFTVSVSSVTNQTVTVNYATADGTATAADGDYAATSGTLTFTPGMTIQTVSVVVNGDIKFETDETFFINLSNANNAFIRQGTISGVILNDDLIPKLSISGPATLTEGDSGSLLATYTVTLADSDGEPITVSYGTANGTATAADGDYAATSGTLTFAPGETTKTFTVAVNGDARFELSEAFTVVLSAPTRGTIISDTATTVIIDTDPAPSMSIDSITLAEGDGSGSTVATFTVSLSAVSGATTTIDFATQNGTATAGSDYIAQSGTLTFAPGETTRNISVIVNRDQTNEPDENFSVVLTNPTNGTINVGTGTATVTDDDPTLFVGQPVMVTEANGTVNVTFMVTLSVVSSQTATVNYATMDGTAAAGADYTATTGTLVFAPGVTTRSFTVPVLGDLLNETPENFFVVLSGAVNALIGGNGTLTATINNDDPQPFVSVASPTAVAEGAGTVGFTVSLSAPSGQPVTINFATLDGTATLVDGDYTQTVGSVTFLPGETTKVVNVPVSVDTRNELNETLGLKLSNATNAGIGTDTATGTITNDDPLPTVSISAPTPVAEGNIGSAGVAFTVTLSAASGLAVSVNFSTSDGTATMIDNDYLATSGLLNFAPGETTKTIVVPVNGDTRSEGTESFNVTLSAASNAAIGVATAAAMITDNDTPPLIVVGNATVTEGDAGVTNATVTVSLSAVSGQPVTVDFTTQSVVAVVGRDFVATSGRVTFAPGEVFKTITVPVMGDAIDENTETFRVVLSNPVGAIVSAGVGTATIIDDESGQLVFAPGDASQPVLLLDSQTGQMRTIPSPFPGFQGEVRVAKGDVNGDGAIDVVFSTGPGTMPQIVVVSGQDGTTLASFLAYRVRFTGGVQIAVADVNGDGFADIIAGAGAGGGPHIQVFSGLDFSIIQSFFAYDPGFTLGVTVAAGDINGDGFADIITGAGAGGAPHVRAFSGLDQSELASFFAYGTNFTGGVAVAAGDLNGDGLADIVTAAGVDGASHVRGFDARGQSELASFFAYNPLYRGTVQVATTDADGDGRFEIVTAAGKGGGPHVKRFTADGIELDSRFAGDPNFLGGIFVG